MKIKINKQPQGSVLMVTLLATLIVGLALSSFLTLVSVQNQSTLRSQAWNSSIPVMEAGVEEALTALQYYRSAKMTNSGWTLNPADGFYHTSGSLRNGSSQNTNTQNTYSYDVGIKLPLLGQPDQPIIECFGYTPSPANLATSPDRRLNNAYGMILGGLVPLFTPDVKTTKRKVQVITK